VDISEVLLISVVDDDPSVLEGVIGLMESVGYPAVGFRSAEEFLNSAQLCRTACLILDVHMPGMGGFELQRRLIAAADHIPIIFITAHGETNVSAQAFRQGAVAFLRKPFSQESLLEAVRSSFARRAGPSAHEKPP